ncbi:hypothetical protein FQN54_004293 [Arachnomyces sp. PD_36]|nr:hypothetical protein FQN54_004293 [Arachnomyces sp. PD_36]
MSYLGQATPHALCPRCLLHNGFVLTRTPTLSTSSRGIGEGVGGWLHAHSRDGIRPARRRYYSSPGKSKKRRDIVPDSLKETLQLHRTLNRQSLIRRVDYDGDSPVVFRPEASYTSKDAKLDTSITPTEEPRQVGDESPLSDHPASTTEAQEPVIRRQIVHKSRRAEHPGRRGKKQPKGKERPKRRQKDKHPFDPDAKIRSTPWAKREDISWEVGKGQTAQYPWLEHLPEQEQSQDGLSRLNAEIEAFEKFMIPSTQETEVCDQVISNTADLIAKNLRISRPICIGSRSTGMSLTHSDIDLFIPIKDPARPSDGGRGPSPSRPKALRSKLRCLKKVEHVLAESGEFRHIVATRARVPIVAAVHGRTGLDIQFQCGDEGRGIPSSYQYVKNYQVEFPTLRAIYAVIRMALETRGLFGGVNQCIGTYGLTMMIVAALKMGDGMYHRRDDVGKQLLHVLRLYSHIDFRRKGVAVEPPGFFKKKDALNTKPATTTSSTTINLTEEEEEEMDIYDPNEEAHIRGKRLITKMALKTPVKGGRICIQDPADYTNDLGRTCVMTLEIRNTFSDVLEGLEREVKKWDTRLEVEGENGNGNVATDAEGKKKEENLSKPILGPALGANYEDLELARDKVVYGSWFN